MEKFDHKDRLVEVMDSLLALDEHMKAVKSILSNVVTSTVILPEIVEAYKVIRDCAFGDVDTSDELANKIRAEIDKRAAKNCSTFDRRVAFEMSSISRKLMPELKDTFDVYAVIESDPDEREWLYSWDSESKGDQ